MNFPKGFVFGAASASYQIEGGAFADDKGASVWDTFSHIPGKIADGQNGDIACDSYHRYEEDLDILKELGISHYRFSISWPRIMPHGHGAVSKAGLDYYDRVIDGCIERGIEPWITLYHWDLPQALQDEGGWKNRRTAEYYKEYTRTVVRHFGTRVSHYITLNEPQVVIGNGYCNGEFAPGLCLEPEEQFLCWHNLMLAHGLAAAVIRESAPHAQIGVASCGMIGCLEEHPEDTPAEVADFTFSSYEEEDKTASCFCNHWFLDPICKGSYPEDTLSPWYEYSGQVSPADLETICCPPDFIGLNIYHGVILDPDNDYRPLPLYPGHPKTAFNWPVVPESLYWGPRLIYERYGLPIVITENGLSCNDRIFLDGKVHDPDRIDFLERYLSEYARAGEDGIPIKGYFHWSLTDNFEWASGYNQRFGLVYIDYRTCDRTIKDSARWYSELIRRCR